MVARGLCHDWHAKQCFPTTSFARGLCSDQCVLEDFFMSCSGTHLCFVLDHVIGVWFFIFDLATSFLRHLLASSGTTWIHVVYRRHIFSFSTVYMDTCIRLGKSFFFFKEHLISSLKISCQNWSKTRAVFYDWSMALGSGRYYRGQHIKRSGTSCGGIDPYSLMAHHGPHHPKMVRPV
jgi:hypothetical protein